MTSSTQSGTIDGINYASSKYVYDANGGGYVTDILYYDQSGKQVADQTIFLTPPFGTTGPTHNSDGTFSITVTPPNGGADPTYEVETFNSAGIWIGSADYASGTIETGHSVVEATGAGSRGTINGTDYDMVIAIYNAGGRLIETDYYNGTGGEGRQLVGTVYQPNPIISLLPNTTATAGTADTPLYISFTDSWASQHAGSLALNLSVDAGTLSGTDSKGNAFSATAGAAVHLTGTVAQLDADLASLSFIDQSAGTAHLTVQVYDQAGLSATATQTITVGAAPGNGGTGASSPNPVVSGPTSLTFPAGQLVQSLNVTFSDPWAVNHAGSLALNVSTTIGTLIDDVNGQSATGTSLHLTGTYAQIQVDLHQLTLASSQAGTGTVRIEVYDQAGVESAHLVGVTFQPPASA